MTIIFQLFSYTFFSWDPSYVYVKLADILPQITEYFLWPSFCIILLLFIQVYWHFILLFLHFYPSMLNQLINQSSEIFISKIYLFLDFPLLLFRFSYYFFSVNCEHTEYILLDHLTSFSVNYIISVISVSIDWLSSWLWTTISCFFTY